MTMRVGDLYADLSLRMTNFSSGLNQAVNEVERAGKRMQNTVGPQLIEATEASGKRMQSFTWQVRGFVKDTSRVITGILISQAFYKLINVIQQATAELVSFNDEMQKAAISFSVLLKSEKESAVFVEALRIFAEETPFTFQDAELGARRLMAMGFAAENVIPIMRNVADMTAVVGGNAETLDRITRALGQIKTKGRLMAEELRQLHEVGVPALKILEKELGLTQKQLENIGDYKIPADAAIIALLKGIQANFGGAAEKMEQTTGAIVTRIGERLMFLGNTVFAETFENLRLKLSGLADALGEALTGAKGGGLAGAIKALAPPEMQGAVLRVVAALGSLWRSLKNLWEAIKPVASAFGGVLLQTLSIILPIVAAVADVFSNMAKVVMTCHPIVRQLAIAISGLAVAGVVTVLLEKLYIAMSLLMVSGPVATLILHLRNAIISLSAAMMRNPWIALATVAAAALLTIAMSSKTASQWLDHLMSRVAKMAGMDYGETFDPTDPEAMAAALNKYNQDLTKSDIDLSKIGETAAKAGKAVKDTFIASFDEVHDIPDKLDDAGNSLLDILGGLTGSIPAIELPGTTKTDPDLGEAFKNFKMPDEIKLPILVWPLPPTSPPPGAVATAIIATVVTMLKKEFSVANQHLREFVEGVSTRLNEVGQAFTTAAERVRNWRENVQLQLRQSLVDVNTWVTTTLQGVQTWIRDTANGFATWRTNLRTTVATTFAEIRISITAAMYSVGQKVSETLGNIATFWSQHKWEILAIVGAIIGGIILAFATLPAGVGLALASLAVAVLGMFTNTKTAVAAEVGQLKQDTIDKFQQLKNTVSTLVEQLKSDIVATYEKLKLALSTKMQEIYQNTITKWTEIGKGVIDSFKTSVTDKLTEIKGAAQSILDAFVDTLSNLPSVLLGLAKDAISGLISYISSVRLPSLSIGGAPTGGGGAFSGGGGSGGGTGSSSSWGSGIQSGDVLRDVVSDVSYDPASNTVTVGGHTFTNGEIPGTTLNNGVTTVTDPSAFRNAVGLKYGGITTKESLYRLSEGNKREAVLPLNEPGISPLVNSLVQGLIPAIEASVYPALRTLQTGKQLPPLNVGIMIADSASLRTFARKIKPFLDEEDVRMYGEVVRRA